MQGTGELNLSCWRSAVSALRGDLSQVPVTAMTVGRDALPSIILPRTVRHVNAEYCAKATIEGFGNALGGSRLQSLLIAVNASQLPQLSVQTLREVAVTIEVDNATFSNACVWASNVIRQHSDLQICRVTLINSGNSGACGVPMSLHTLAEAGGAHERMNKFDVEMWPIESGDAAMAIRCHLADSLQGWCHVNAEERQSAHGWWSCRVCCT